MPDAYENINMAMRSMLTTDILADDEDPYLQFSGNNKRARFVLRSKHAKCVNAS